MWIHPIEKNWPWTWKEWKILGIVQELQCNPIYPPPGGEPHIPAALCSFLLLPRTKGGLWILMRSSLLNQAVPFLLKEPFHYLTHAYNCLQDWLWQIDDNEAFPKDKKENEHFFFFNGPPIVLLAIRGVVSDLQWSQTLFKTKNI